jgi:methionine sulfoxide reductase catalytic subunit
MGIYQPPDIPSSEVTPQHLYFNRRKFLQALGLTASVAATGGVYRLLNPRRARPPAQALEKLAVVPSDEAMKAAYTADEPKTPRDDVASYNNFYEFSTEKTAVADAARNFVSRPWTMEVGGLAGAPRTFDLDDLRKIGLEERVYRHRCVETWSMVIPWLGFELASLLKRVDPLASAKYVAFETLLDPERMPNQDSAVLPWPYVEGLRMDEAMHPLAILAMGLYGQTLPPQNGAPVRLVVPWKYGFKGCKSIVKITLVEKQPPTTWSRYAPSAYGFYCNVNPAVDRPWPQDRERRLPGFSPRPTLPFNGYAQQVAHLYAGMDLAQYY